MTGPIRVHTGSPLETTFTLHAPTGGTEREGIIVVHHGICHTLAHFVDLIAALNDLGFHVAMIEQQSENAGFFRNCIGMRSYRRGMAAAVRAIEIETNKKVRCYVLHSMGAMIGEEMQGQHCNRDLRRATVLMAPIPMHGAGPVTLKLFFSDILAYLRTVATFNVHALAETPKQVKRLFFDKDTCDGTVEAARKELKHAPFWMYIRLILRPLIFWRWIFNNGEPKLLLYSTTDWLFHHKYGYMLTRFWYRPLQEAPIAGGHDFFIEQASETADQIAGFCDAEKNETGKPVVPSPHFALNESLPRPETLPGASQMEH